MLVLLALIFVILVLWILWKRLPFYRLQLKLNGPSGYPLLGIAHLFLNREETFSVRERLFAKFGTVLFSWIGPVPALFLSEPKIIEQVLTKNLKKGSFYSQVSEILGSGLLSQNDPEWTVHRRLLNPSFNPKVIHSLFPIFNEETSEYLKTLDKFVGQGDIDLESSLFNFVLLTAARTTGGSVLNTATPEKKEELYLAAEYLLDKAAYIVMRPWFQSKILRACSSRFRYFETSKETLKNFANMVIDKKISEDLKYDEQTDEVEQSIFINMGIKFYRQGNFTLQQLQGHCLNLVAAAIETTMGTVFKVLMLLAMFPEYEKRLLEEIKSLFPERGDHEVTVSDVQNMPYMDMIMNETMRIFSPVPLVIREIDEDLKLSNGVILPRGLQVFICIYELHRRNDLWGPDAQTFNPDHFLPSNIDKMHPYAFIPFTKGRRMCIGWRYALLSMKVILIKILRNYRFTTEFKFEDLKCVDHISSKFKETPLLKVHRRD